MPRFSQIWRGLEPRGQLTLVVSGLLVVATLVFLFQYASKPSYTTVAAGLEPSETADAQRALSGAGLDVRIENGGTAVAVRKGQEGDAQVALAGAGLPKGGHVGFEIFDEKSISASDFQQKVDYQRALEGEIARTIETIDGVGGAQVQLVLPEDSLFADEGPQASAAVLLSGGEVLDSGAVSGIARLVASSVKGLKPKDVTITDGTGALLWPTADVVEGGPSAQSQLEAEARYDAVLSGQIQAFLTSTLGPGKAQVRVHADLDLDQRTVDRVTYAKKGVPLEIQKEEETLTSEGGSSAAPAGAASNIPSFAGSTAVAGKSDYSRTTEHTTMGVDKTVERTTTVPGTVKKLDVALLVDSKVSAEQVSALKDAVTSLAGIDEERGDTLSVQSIEFAPPPKPAAAPSPVAGIMANPLGALKWIGLAFATLFFLFTVRKSLRARQSEPVVIEPTWLREIEGATSLAELNPGPRIDADGQRRQVQKEQVEEIIHRQPEQIARQVSTWMKE
jgi:flagellar M-ring protein FliF